MPAAPAAPPALAKTPGRSTGRRLWLLRFLAIACGLSLFLFVELACRLFGLGEPDTGDDPFVGFSGLQPLFVRDESGQRYVTAPARRKFFLDDSFPVQKAPGTVRVFCLGGSTVQGNPFGIETSFTIWLRLALEQAEPGKRWEIVNCGGISYASYRLVPILEECLKYEPDLFIVCTGENEFLEDRTYGDLRDQPEWISRPHQQLARLRSYHVYRDLLLKLVPSTESQKPVLRTEVDAFLDYRDGLRAYQRDDGWRDGVARHYEFNLHRMARIASEQGVPLLFMRPLSNLGDTPPFKSEHRQGLPDSQRIQFERLVTEARTQMTVSVSRAVRLLEQARDIDPQFAGVRFHLGKLYESQSRFEEARSEYLAARNEDICPLRIIQPLETALRDVAQTRHVPLLDAHELLESHTKHGILDNSLMVDHVHPSFEGHQVIARALVDELRKLNLVSPQPDWEKRSQHAFREHFESLPPFYFAKGQQTLNRLRHWTQGEADGPDVETRYPEKVGAAAPPTR